MRVCHFEDNLALNFEPLTLTRPVFDLLCGCLTLGDKQAQAFAATSRAAIVRAHLADLTRLTHLDMPVNDSALTGDVPVVLVNARWLPAAPPALPERPDRPCVGLVDGEVAYAALSAEQAATLRPDAIEEDLARLHRLLPAHEAPGRLLRRLWELVECNGDEVVLDAWLSDPRWARRDVGDVAHIGPGERIHIHPSAKIEPHVVIDASGGPVVIEIDAVVGAFTRLEGPCYVGAGTHVLGAKVRAGTSFGPCCRIGGEVEASIVLGYSNKYHDGFLGHAYVGEWVNLGAGTSNSDLRNDYGEVSVVVGGVRENTGRTKVGCFLGDHTKTGLGTLLNTGTTAGVFSQLLPTGGLLPKFVPSFAGIWNGNLVENADLPALLRTADVVMRRRQKSLTEVHESLYRTICEQTGAHRRAALRDAETRRLRRSA